MRVFWLLMLLGYGTAGAQMPAATVDEALVSMAQRAGVIFAGQVLSVERRDAAGLVEMRFAVQEAVRGCKAGSVYTLLEWGGLWAGQAERYRAGQRLLVMLYAPGPGGLSSPVDRQAGLVPIAGLDVDLRWVAAGAVRAAEPAKVPVHGGPENVFARATGPILLGQGNYAAVMGTLRGAVGAPVVRPILGLRRPVAAHMER